MQESVVHRIRAIFDNLHPVARHAHPKGHHLVVLWVIHAIVGWEFRQVVNGPHVGKDQTLPLTNWIGALREIVFSFARFWLRWSVQNGAIDIKVPTVITTANASLSNNAKLKRRAAVHTVAVQEPKPRGLVTKNHQILAKQPHSDG